MLDCMHYTYTLYNTMYTKTHKKKLLNQLMTGEHIHQISIVFFVHAAKVRWLH